MGTRQSQKNDEFFTIELAMDEERDRRWLAEMAHKSGKFTPLQIEGEVRRCIEERSTPLLWSPKFSRPHGFVTLTQPMDQRSGNDYLLISLGYIDATAKEYALDFWLIAYGITMHAIYHDPDTPLPIYISTPHSAFQNLNPVQKIGFRQCTQNEDVPYDLVEDKKKGTLLRLPLGNEKTIAKQIHLFNGIVCLEKGRKVFLEMGWLNTEAGRKMLSSLIFGYRDEDDANTPPIER